MTSTKIKNKEAILRAVNAHVSGTPSIFIEYGNTYLYLSTLSITSITIEDTIKILSDYGWRCDFWRVTKTKMNLDTIEVDGIKFKMVDPNIVTTNFL